MDTIYLTIFAGAIGALVLGMRIFEWNNQRKILAKAAEAGHPLKREKVSIKRVWIYVGLLGFALVMIFFMEEELLTKVALGILFALMLMSEIIGMYTSYALYANEREFMYGTEVLRYKSIRTMKPKNKKNMEIHGMNGVVITVPNAIADVIKAKKDVKKTQPV